MPTDKKAWIFVYSLKKKKVYKKTDSQVFIQNPQATLKAELYLL